MLTHTIEPGQRLGMLAASTTVTVISEAIVPAGYWICRDESSGQQRVVAHTVLVPLPAEPVVGAPVVGTPVVGTPVVGDTVGSVVPVPATAA